MIIAAAAIVVISCALMLTKLAGTLEGSSGYLEEGLGSPLITGTDRISVGQAFYDEMGVFATDSPKEEGRAYRPLDPNDPVTADMAQRYLNLYGHLIDEAQARAFQRGGRRLALAGAQESGDFDQLPVFLDQGITDNTLRQVILTPLLSVVPMRTATVDWINTVSSPDAEYILAANEGDLPTSQDNAYDAQRLDVSVLAARVELTGLSQAVSQGFVDFSQSVIQRRMRAFLETTENEIINGTNTATGGHDGLVQMATTNTVDLLTATITTDDIDDLIQQINENNGHPNLGLASHKIVNDIKAELKAKQELPIGGSPQIAVAGFDFPGGMNVVNYNGIQIMGSNFVNNTPADRDLFLISTEQLRIRELRPMMLERLAKVRDADDWAITRYYTLQDMSANDTSGPPGDGTGGQFHGRILNAA